MHWSELLNVSETFGSAGKAEQGSVLPKTDDRLWQIQAPHFTAGAEFINGVCSRAAPIIRWMVGKTDVDLQAHCRRKGWTITAC
jgi:hypothetical protein